MKYDIALLSDAEFIKQNFKVSNRSKKVSGIYLNNKFYLKKHIKNEMDNAIITLDNALVYTSIQTRNLLSRLIIIASLMPPYSSKLAPVELFLNIIKSK